MRLIVLLQFQDFNLYSINQYHSNMPGLYMHPYVATGLQLFNSSVVGKNTCGFLCLCGCAR